MSGVVAQAAGLVAFPVGAAAIGATAAAFRRPGARVTSGVQHFAAGVVLAAVAGELLPELRLEGRLGAVVVGFVAGVGVLLALGALSRRQEAAARRRAGGGAGRLPLGLLVAVGIDLLIDGLLVGLGVTLGSNQGLILTVALTTEILFLAVAVCIQLQELGVPRVRSATVAGSLGLATAVGAVGGADLLGGASRTVLAAVLAFSAAALLYLVVEELLVEAHEQARTALVDSTFFLGFLALYILATLGG
ncbi:ZIP family metal transporter [Rhodococcus aerolatus]